MDKIFPDIGMNIYQVYYFISGTAKLECGKNNFEVQANDLVIVNPNELHYLESTSDNLVFIL